MMENVGMMAAGAPVFPWKRIENVRLAHAYVPGSCCAARCRRPVAEAPYSLN